MVGPLRDVQLKTVIAMSALPPDEEKDNDTKARSPTTEPSANVNRTWQLVQTVIAPTAEKVADSTVLMPPPDFKETRASVSDATPIDGSSSVRARRDELKTDPARQALPTQELPGPRPSRPISQESRERAMGLKPRRPRWIYALGGGALLVGALALYLVFR
jgi:hypothetical protein